MDKVLYDGINFLVIDGCSFPDNIELKEQGVGVFKGIANSFLELKRGEFRKKIPGPVYIVQPSDLPGYKVPHFDIYTADLEEVGHRLKEINIKWKDITNTNKDIKAALDKYVESLN